MIKIEDSIEFYDFEDFSFSKYNMTDDKAKVMGCDSQTKKNENYRINFKTLEDDNISSSTVEFDNQVNIKLKINNFIPKIQKKIRQNTNKLKEFKLHHKLNKKKHNKLKFKSLHQIKLKNSKSPIKHDSKIENKLMKITPSTISEDDEEFQDDITNANCKIQYQNLVDRYQYESSNIKDLMGLQNIEKKLIEPIESSDIIISKNGNSLCFIESQPEIFIYNSTEIELPNQIQLPLGEKSIINEELQQSEGYSFHIFSEKDEDSMQDQSFSSYTSLFGDLQNENEINTNDDIQKEINQFNNIIRDGQLQKERSKTAVGTEFQAILPAFQLSKERSVIAVGAEFQAILPALQEKTNLIASTKYSRINHECKWNPSLIDRSELDNLFIWLQEYISLNHINEQKILDILVTSGYDIEKTKENIMKITKQSLKNKMKIKNRMRMLEELN